MSLERALETMDFWITSTKGVLVSIAMSPRTTQTDLDEAAKLLSEADDAFDAFLLNGSTGGSVDEPMARAINVAERSRLLLDRLIDQARGEPPSPTVQ